LTHEDRVAREEAERTVAKELGDLFGNADRVEVVDVGHGLSRWSATFNLDKKSSQKAKE